LKTFLRAARIGRVLLRYRLDALLDDTAAELGYRLPLTPLSAQYHDVVRNALKDAGLL